MASATPAAMTGVMTGMTPEMTRFHDQLRPRWHAEKGPQRVTDTCGAIPQFKTEADAIGKATPPTTTTPDTWTTGTRALAAAVDKLAAACTANDAAQFETAFAGVHDSFHSLMQAAGVQHGPEHEGHHDGHHMHHHGG